MTEGVVSGNFEVRNMINLFREIFVLKRSDYFIEKFNQVHGKQIQGISAETMVLLKTHSWPGNIRELGNVIERAVLLSESEEIQSDEIAQLLISPKRFDDVIQCDQSLAGIEQNHIERTLQLTQGNKTEAARKLGISVRTLRNKLKQYQDVA